jgi:hypothetical protein
MFIWSVVALKTPAIFGRAMFTIDESRTTMKVPTETTISTRYARLKPRITRRPRS